MESVKSYNFSVSHLLPKHLNLMFRRRKPHDEESTQIGKHKLDFGVDYDSSRCKVRLVDKENEVVVSPKFRHGFFREAKSAASANLSKTSFVTCSHRSNQGIGSSQNIVQQVAEKPDFEVTNKLRKRVTPELSHTPLDDIASCATEANDLKFRPEEQKKTPKYVTQLFHLSIHFTPSLDSEFSTNTRRHSNRQSTRSIAVKNLNRNGSTSTLQSSNQLSNVASASLIESSPKIQTRFGSSEKRKLHDGEMCLSSQATVYSSRPESHALDGTLNLLNGDTLSSVSSVFHSVNTIFDDDRDARCSTTPIACGTAITSHSFSISEPNRLLYSTEPYFNPRFVNPSSGFSYSTLKSMACKENEVITPGWRVTEPVSGSCNRSLRPHKSVTSASASRDEEMMLEDLQDNRIEARHSRLARDEKRSEKIAQRQRKEKEIKERFERKLKNHLTSSSVSSELNLSKKIDLPNSLFCYPFRPRRIKLCEDVPVSAFGCGLRQIESSPFIYKKVS